MRIIYHFPFLDKYNMFIYSKRGFLVKKSLSFLMSKDTLLWPAVSLLLDGIDHYSFNNNSQRKFLEAHVVHSCMKIGGTLSHTLLVGRVRSIHKIDSSNTIKSMRRGHIHTASSSVARLEMIFFLKRGQKLCPNLLIKKRKWFLVLVVNTNACEFFLFIFLVD
jgi:hypothetical protein